MNDDIIVTISEETIQASFTDSAALEIDIGEVSGLSVPTKLSELEDDATHRLVTDTEKASWNAKQPAGNYATVEDIPTKTSDLTNDSGFITDISGKVDKVAGKGLSTNDLTNELKLSYDTAASQTHTHSNKTALDSVSGINTGDQEIPDALSDLSEDSTHRTVTDTEKSTWNAKQSALDFTPENAANRNANNGYCGLDSGGKVPMANLPTTLLKYMGVWNATTNNPTLASPDLTKIGQVYNVSVAGTQFGIIFNLGDWAIYNASGVVEKSDNSDDVVSVNGQTGVVVIDKTSVGLGNVDNTSDADKPISTATSTALGLKVDKVTGKGLSTNDLTDVLVTTWNAKQDAIGYTAANDSAVVHNTGNESIAGIKTFINNQNVGNTTTGANQYIIGTLNATEKFTSFTVAGNWTLTTGWESTNNGGTQLNHNAAGTTTALFLQNSPTIGKTYKVSITALATVTGGFTVSYGAQTTANINPVVGTPTTYDLYLTPTSVANLTITPVTTARFTITAISIKEVGADSTGSLTVDKDIFLSGKIKHKNATLGLQMLPAGQAVFGGSVTAVGIAAGGAISGATTVAMSGAATTTQTTTTTPVTGFVTTTAAALVGTPVRISPSVYWNSTAWNTTPTAASKANAIQAYYLPVSGAVTSGALIFANATVDGVANTNQLMRINSAGQFGVGATTFLSAGNIINAYGTNTGTIQVNSQNASNGTSASADHVATADTGTDSANFIDMGINSSTYSDAAFTIGGALTGYLYTNGGDLAIGTQTSAKIIKFHTGGTLAANERVRITDVGLGVGSTATLTAPIQVTGIAEYVDNAAAVTAGLTVGAFYRTGDILKIVH